jgi:hypothetical protein
MQGALAARHRRPSLPRLDGGDGDAALLVTPQTVHQGALSTC